MQKKLLAVAVLSAFSGAAAAQSANVTLYGNIVTHIEAVSTVGGDASVAPVAPALTSSARTGVGAIRVAAAAPGVAGVATQGNVMRFNPAGSNFGLRGTEDLGNGLSAWFQVELSTNYGANPPNNQNNVGQAPTHRNTGVGLRSRTWGTVLFGVWDTPFNVLAGSLGVNGRTGGASTGQQANLLGATMYGQGAVSGQTTANWCAGAALGGAATNCFNYGTNFDRRERSSMQWWSPNWNGFEARASFNVTQNTGGITLDNQALGRNALKENIWDLTLNYTNGPLNVAYGYARQNDTLAAASRTFTGSVTGGAGGTATGTIAAGEGTGAWTLGTATAATNNAHMSGSRGVGHRLGAKYTFSGIGGGNLGLGVMWESLKWDMSYGLDNLPANGALAAATGNVLTQLKKTAWRAQANYAWGAHHLGVDYTRANALTGSISNVSTLATAATTNTFDGSGTGARSWVLGYNYSLSKRTSIGGYWNQVRNDTNANYSGIVFGGVVGAAGSTTRYTGMQLRHSF